MAGKSGTFSDTGTQVNVTGGSGTVVTSGTPAAHQAALFSNATTIKGITPGVAGLVLTSNGTSADPTFQALATSGASLPGSPFAGQEFILTSSALQPAGRYIYSSGKWLSESMPNMGIYRFTMDGSIAWGSVLELAFSDWLVSPLISLDNYQNSAWLYTPGRGLKNFAFTFTAGNVIYAATPNAAGLLYAAGDAFTIAEPIPGTVGIVTTIAAGGAATGVSFESIDGALPAQGYANATGVATQVLSGSGDGNLTIDITQVGPYIQDAAMESGATGYVAFPDSTSIQYLNQASSRATLIDASELSSIVLMDIGGSPFLTSVTLNATAMLYPQVNNCALPSSNINSILAALVAAGLHNGQALLQGQTPSAPPTGQGVTDKATLITRGWTVTTD